MINWKSLCLIDTSTIADAMAQLGATGAKFVCVVDANCALKGVVTDGDIRRALLQKETISSGVLAATNTKPKVYSFSETQRLSKETLLKQNITHLPVVNEAGIVVDILDVMFEGDKYSNKNNAVIIMAGGLGSRLGQLTENCPKPMLKIDNKPILEIIIENLRSFGFKNFTISVNYKADMIESYFGDGSSFDVNISYIKEPVRLGTAGCLSLYKKINDLPVLVMNGDVLTKINFSNILDQLNQHDLDGVVCTYEHNYQIPYGVIETKNNLIENLVEKPIHTVNVSAGIYAFKPELFEFIPQNQFYDMPSFISDLIGRNKRVGTYHNTEHWLDIGQHDDFSQAESFYKKIK